VLAGVLDAAERVVPELPRSLTRLGDIRQPTEPIVGVSRRQSLAGGDAGLRDFQAAQQVARVVGDRSAGSGASRFVGERLPGEATEIVVQVGGRGGVVIAGGAVGVRRFDRGESA